MGTIGFNAGQIISNATEAIDHCNSLKRSFAEIENQLETLSSNANWNGPIKDSASSDFENAKASMKELNNSILSSFQTLQNIGESFRSIQY